MCLLRGWQSSRRVLLDLLVVSGQGDAYAFHCDFRSAVPGEGRTSRGNKTDQTAAFSTIYSACHASTAVCGAVSRTETADPVTTTKFIEPACHSVNNMYRSCIAETFDFTNLPFGRQASCYWYVSPRGGIYQGSVNGKPSNAQRQLPDRPRPYQLDG